MKDLKNIFEKWQKYAYAENQDDIAINNSIVLMNELEMNLLFEDEEEHQKWLDVLESFKDPTEFEKMTYAIIERTLINKSCSIECYNYKLNKMRKISFMCDELKDKLEEAYIKNLDQDTIDKRLDAYFIKLCELNDYKRILAKMRRGECIC